MPRSSRPPAARIFRAALSAVLRRRRPRVLASAALLAALGVAACTEKSDGRGTSVSGTPFDGERAMTYVKAQLDFGPRIPGSAGWKATGDWIVAQMRTRADTVLVQEWTHTTADGKALPMRNVLARFNPTATDRVLYVTHWDTRPFADDSPDPADRRKPVMGANDGASGVALFVALGDALKQARPSVGVDLLFVDGEDYGDFGKDQDVLIGSKYFAEHLPTPGYRPIFGVLWDMIGDADLHIYQEGNSVSAAPEVVQRVWDTARQTGHSDVFVATTEYNVTDDHIPLIAKGLRVVDVIDLDYTAPSGQQPNYHHTTQDTIDKVSAKSLKTVGDVALALVQ